MIQRLSVNLLLKSVILTLSAAIIVVLSLSAWSSWQRQATVKRIAGVVETSANFFSALHNLRVDRSTTSRELNSDRVYPTLPDVLRTLRDAEMPPLKAGLVSMAAVDFPGHDAAVEKLDKAIKRLEALHKESADALAQPKASRRPGLAKEFFEESDNLVRMIDSLTSQLTASVKLEDGYIDQLLQLKQLAWLARNAGGDASVMISNKLGGTPLPPDALLIYTANIAKVELAWATLEDVSTGLTLPDAFHKAVANAKREFLGADYTALRLKTLKALIAGEPVEHNVETWMPMWSAS